MNSVLTLTMKRHNFYQLLNPYVMSKSYLLSAGILLSTIATAQPAMPIHDIQFTADISGESPMVNTLVKTYGIVTGVFNLGATNSFFIQDGEGEWNGLYINTNAFSVVVGDSIEVSGTIEEYFGLTQMSNVQTLTIISSGNPLPTVTDVNIEMANFESFESVYIKVINATCTEDNSGLGQFIINDGSSSCIVDDDIFHYTPQEQNIYHISGIRYFYLGEIKLFPTKSEDIELIAAVSIEENFSEVSIYPNPSNSVLNLEIPEQMNFTIYDMHGKNILSGNGNTIIDVSTFDSGIYQIKIDDGIKSEFRKFVVQ